MTLIVIINSKRPELLAFSMPKRVVLPLMTGVNKALESLV